MLRDMICTWYLCAHANAPAPACSERFQLSYIGHEGGEDAGEAQERFQWALCHKALPLAAMKKLGVPLAGEQVQVLYSSLAWEEIQWSNTAVKVKEQSYRIMRVYFMPRCKAQS
jgi:hypothetical protein